MLIQFQIYDILAWVGWVSSMHCHSKLPLPPKITKQTIHQLSTDHIYGQFQAASLLSRVDGDGNNQTWQLRMKLTSILFCKYLRNQRSDLYEIWNLSPFLYNTREPKYKQNNMRHPISRQKINQCLQIKFWFPHISAPWYHTEMFCTPDGATDLTFQMR